MSYVGQQERVAQNRIVRSFSDESGYCRYLGFISRLQYSEVFGVSN